MAQRGLAMTNAIAGMATPSPFWLSASASARASAQVPRHHRRSGSAALRLPATVRGEAIKEKPRGSLPYCCSL